MQLTTITIEGAMTGTLWQDAFDSEAEDAEIAFSQDFLVGAHSPWAIDWTDIREALLHVTNCGDVVGGMGLILEASITFTHCGEGRTDRRTIELKPGRYTHDFFFDSGEHSGWPVTKN